MVKNCCLVYKRLTGMNDWDIRKDSIHIKYRIVIGTLFLQYF
jgi:hypothetical protein